MVIFSRRFERTNSKPCWISMTGTVFFIFFVVVHSSFYFFESDFLTTQQTTAGNKQIKQDSPTYNDKLLPQLWQEGDKIAYLTQGPAKNYDAIAKRFENLGESAILFYHSFDEKCNGCIFQAKTSFASGRNLLLKAAYNTHPGIKYFVFFDDDVVFRLCESDDGRTETGQACWRSFHSMLLRKETQQPFLKPAYHGFDKFHEQISYQSCTDENFWVIRYDQIHFLWPYSTKFDKTNWWMNAALKYNLIEQCYPNAFFVSGQYWIGNPEHREYPGLLLDQQNVNQVMEELYPKLGPWNHRTKLLNHRCNVSPTPPKHPMLSICAKVTNERFEKWLAGTFEP
jgi:hypothetical protein